MYAPLSAVRKPRRLRSCLVSELLAIERQTQSKYTTNINSIQKNSAGLLYVVSAPSAVCFTYYNRGSPLKTFLEALNDRVSSPSPCHLLYIWTQTKSKSDAWSTFLLLYKLTGSWSMSALSSRHSKYSTTATCLDAGSLLSGNLENIGNVSSVLPLYICSNQRRACWCLLLCSQFFHNAQLQLLYSASSSFLFLKSFEFSYSVAFQVRNGKRPYFGSGLALLQDFRV